MRKNPLSNGSYYHIVNRSIAKFEIFNSADDYGRMINLLNFYRFTDFPCKYSEFLRLCQNRQKAIVSDLLKSGEMMVVIVAYCIMPTHIHLLLKQETDNGISRFIAKVLDSYSKYFNIKYHRKGPLWEGHFKNILVSKDEQLIHLTRYIHLNPTSAGLVKKPEDWEHSSYHEYISSSRKEGADILCQFNELIDMPPKDYEKFVSDRIAYQKEISKIKHLLLEGYGG